MTPETFTCANCGQTFDKGRSDEEAMAESVAGFGEYDPDDLCVVCDDCYQAIMARPVEAIVDGHMAYLKAFEAAFLEEWDAYAKQTTERMLHEVVIDPLKRWINDMPVIESIGPTKRSGLFNAADLPRHKRHR